MYGNPALPLALALALLLHVPTPQPWGSLLSAALGALIFGLLVLGARPSPPGELDAEPGLQPTAGRRPPRWVLPLAAVGLSAACGLQELQAIFHLPIDAQFADMLPLIRSALASLGSGVQPYRTYLFPWPLPLTFLPGLWLSYLPAWFAGVDLRLLGLAASLLMLARLAGLSTRRGGLAAGLVLLLLATGSKFTELARVGHLPVYWMLLVLFADAWIAGRRSAALSLALLLATRQTAWLLLPPLALFELRIRSGPGGRPRIVLPAVGLAALIVVPFLAVSPAAFLHGTVGWYGSLGSLVYASEPLTVLGQPGLGGAMHLLGVPALLPVLALGAVILCWRLGSGDAAGSLGRSALAMGAFALCSAPCWWYSLLDPVLLLAVVQARPQPGPHETRWRRLAGIAGVAIAVAWIGVDPPQVDALHFDRTSTPRLVQGFSGPERWGPRTIQWALAPRATLALPRLQPFSGELVLVLRPSPRLQGPLDLELNGDALGSVRPVPSWSAVRLKIVPGRLVIGNNCLVLRGSATPASAADPRRMLAALDELVLVETPAVPSSAPSEP